jgi:hypothetical protein
MFSNARLAFAIVVAIVAIVATAGSADRHAQRAGDAASQASTHNSAAQNTLRPMLSQPR